MGYGHEPQCSSAVGAPSPRSRPIWGGQPPSHLPHRPLPDRGLPRPEERPPSLEVDLRHHQWELKEACDLVAHTRTPAPRGQPGSHVRRPAPAGPPTAAPPTADASLDANRVSQPASSAAVRSCRGRAQTDISRSRPSPERGGRRRRWSPGLAGQTMTQPNCKSGKASCRRGAVQRLQEAMVSTGTTAVVSCPSIASRAGDTASTRYNRRGHGRTGAFCGSPHREPPGRLPSVKLASLSRSGCLPISMEACSRPWDASTRPAIGFAGVGNCCCSSI